MLSVPLSLLKSAFDAEKVAEAEDIKSVAEDGGRP